MLALAVFASHMASADELCAAISLGNKACKACATDVGCTRCLRGYVVVRASDNSTAFTCCPQNCLECSRKGACVNLGAANPLLTDLPFPRFDKIKPSDVVPAIDYLQSLANTRYNDTDSLFPYNYTYDQGIAPLARIDERLGRVYSAVSLLSSVISTPEWQSVMAQLQSAMEEHRAKLLQDPRYLRRLDAAAGHAPAAAQRSLQAAPGLVGRLTAAQRRALVLGARDARLWGADLQTSEQIELSSLNSQLSSLGNQFSTRVLQSGAAWTKLVTKKEEVAGLPITALEQAAQQARERGNKPNATAAAGPWLFSLDGPSYFPVIASAQNRALRETLFRARTSQASDTFLDGKYDNTGTVLSILGLRARKARLLGFPSFADLSMQTKMATLKTATALERRLTRHFYEANKRDVETLTAFARSQGFNQSLQLWDQEFYLQRLRADRLKFSADDLAPYLSLPTGLDALFTTIERLFGARFVAADGTQPVWHPDVRLFKVVMRGKPRGFLYLDPYVRPGQKQEGAWTAPLALRSRLSASPGRAVALPVVAVVFNFPRPVGDKPSLLSWRDLQGALFHEFGHALQVLLTSQVEPQVSGGAGIEDDAIEFASQFMENWPLRDPDTLKLLKHYQTGQPIPQNLVDGLLASHDFMVSMDASKGVRQLHFGQTDLALHATLSPPRTAAELLAADRAVIRKNYALLPLPDYKVLTSFSHIFGGGYAAGYYGYKWAEVMALDAFAAFTEAGLDNKTAVSELGAKFRSTVLGLGGSVPAGKVFRRFRGRNARFGSLLRDYGFQA